MDKKTAGVDPAKPDLALNLQRGVSLVSLVATLLILGLLYVGFDSLRRSGNPLLESTETALAQSKDVACRLNRIEIERSLLTWTLSHPGRQPTLEGLREAQIHVQPCPEGGELSVQGRQVRCSLHN